MKAKTGAFIKETVLDGDYVRVRYEHELFVPIEREGPGIPRKELTRLISATVELQRKSRGAYQVRHRQPVAHYCHSEALQSASFAGSGSKPYRQVR